MTIPNGRAVQTTLDIPCNRLRKLTHTIYLLDLVIRVYPAHTYAR